MTITVGFFGARYDFNSLVAAMQRSAESYVKPGSKFHDELPEDIKHELAKPIQSHRPVVTLHDGKYLVLFGEVTEAMKKNGFSAKFLTKYNLNQARSGKQPPKPEPAQPQQVAQLQEKFSKPRIARVYGKKYQDGRSIREDR